MDLTQTTLTELRSSLASKAISARELTRAYLDRIEKYNGTINAIAELFADRAIERAARVDQGELTGPLAGLPIVIKDNLCTTFGHTRCASKMLENYRSPFNATAVQKLEDAGAIILGKTNMDEFAMGSSCEHTIYGRCHNPWQDASVAGGSSGGSAAAVAADLCPASLGSDTGGSIRQPAAYCGVMGLKPTYGRISRWGLVAYASSLDQIGPFAHCADDLALLLQTMAGRDPRDATSSAHPVDDYISSINQPFEKIRIGLARQYMSDANDPTVTKAMEEAVEVYREAGAEIVEVDLPHTEYGIPTYYLVATAEASSNLARYDGVHYGYRTPGCDDLIDLYARSRAEGFGDEVKRRIMLGTYALSSGYYDAYYLKALKVRRLIKQDFDRAFDRENGGVDAILCPVTTAPAFKAGAHSDDPLAMYMNDVYTVNANLAGIPGVAMPAGTAQGLPVGLQLLGPTFSEAGLLRLVKIFEQSTLHHRARPTLAS